MTLKASTIKSKWLGVGLLALLSVVVFFALRLPFLTRIPVFVDEAIYIRWSQIMKNDPTLRFLPLSDGKQPLFMWATMPALKFIADPLVAGRLVSVFSGLFAMTGLAFLVFVIFASPLLAAFSVLIYAILPFTVFFDRMALVDSLLSAFGLWSLGLGILLVKKTRLDLAMFLGFSIGFGLLTKSPAVFFYLWQPVLFLFFFDFKSKDLRSRLTKLALAWLVALIISQMMYNILRLGPNFNLIGSRNQDYVFSLSEVIHHPLNPLIGNLKTTASWIMYLFTPPLVLALFFSLLHTNKRPVLALFAVSLAALFAQGFIAKVYTSRYILFAVTPLIPLVALGGVEIARYTKVRVWLVAFALLLWPVILSILLITSPEKANMPFDMRNGYLEEWTAGWGQKEIADYLIQKAHQGAHIVVGTDGFFGTLPDGLQIYTQGTPNVTVIGGSPYVGSIPEALSNSLKDKANSVYLVANASRVHLSPDDLSRLELIATYAKPARTDGTHESLLFFHLLR